MYLRRQAYLYGSGTAYLYGSGLSHVGLWRLGWGTLWVLWIYGRIEPIY